MELPDQPTLFCAAGNCNWRIVTDSCWSV